MGNRTIGTTVPRTNRHCYRVQCFEFADQGAEIRKADNTFTFEFALPPDLLDDLTHNLSQPTQRVSSGKRKRISGWLQEVSAFIDHGLQTKFNGLPIKHYDRTRIPRILW